MIYTVAAAVMRAWYKLIYRVKISGLENVPAEGGCVVCINHKSNHDPLLVGSFFPRKMAFFAKKELFVPVLGALLKKLGAIPVNRGANDIGAVKSSLRALKDGKPLLIFPQGTRCKELRQEDFKSGATFMAIKSKVPIVPVGISGDYKASGRLTVNIGKIINTEDYAAAGEELNAILYKSIEGLVNNG